MKTFSEFLLEANTQNEAFAQTTAPKLIDKYISKVKPEEVKDKGQVRFDIEDGFYIKFSAVGERNDKEHIILGYRIEIDNRRLELGVGDTIFTDWKTIYSTYYNIETNKFGDSFSKLFHTKEK